MSYLDSDDIIAFPATSRADTYQKDARLLTEESLVRPLRFLRSNESFVISSLSEVEGTNANRNNGPLEFLISGYYFKVGDFSDIKDALGTLSNGHYDLYAIITIEANANGYVEISGSDVSDEYQGIDFQALTVGTTPTITTNQKEIFIGEIYYTSSTYFRLESIGAPPLIDGGEI